MNKKSYHLMSEYHTLVIALTVSVAIVTADVLGICVCILVGDRHCPEHFTCIDSFKPYNSASIIFPILQMRELRYKECK